MLDNMPSQEEVRALFDYDPNTGVFTRLVSRGNRAAGSVAGSVTYYKRPSQYLSIWVGRQILAHQLAFIWMTGKCPEQIDHKNRNGLDNRWCNLRESSYGSNALNHRVRRDSSSGHTGVSFLKDRGKWIAYINRGYKRITVGFFSSLEEAVRERNIACKELHGEFAGEM